MGDAFWVDLLEVRAVVNRALEACRSSGEIKSALDAEVTLYASEDLAQRLASLNEELRFVLITSSATVAPLSDAPDSAFRGDRDDLLVVVTASAAEKCERCWHKREDVGAEPAHPTLCGRCVSNVEGPGETRHYA